MAPWLILAIGVVYCIIAFDLFRAGKPGMSLAFIGYAIGNFGLWDGGAVRVYLAGGIRGIPDYFETFAEYANQLRLDGYSVYNPAAANLEGMPLGRIMAHVLPQLCETEAIALIPGWRKSGGAKIEYLLAVYLGLKVIRL